MEFEIPESSSLPRFTVAALRDLGLEAAAAYDSLREALTPETATDEDLDNLEDLKSFMVQVDDELSTRRDRQRRFSALAAPAKAADDDLDDRDDLEGDDIGGGEVATDSSASENDASHANRGKAKSMTPGGKAKASTSYAVDTTPLPSVKEIASVGTQVLEGELVTGDDNTPKFRILAAADTGFSAGSELDGWLDVARAFVARSHTHSGGTAQQSTVATIKREFSNELSVSDGDDDISIMKKIDFARDETRLPGGSLLAGAGWCAPSETIYTTCSEITTDGLLSLPEIGARRGGIRHNQGIQFDTIFGSGTGFNILTEAQVISDTTKTCVNIPCPSFIDDRLKVAALCLTGDILQNRGYPEFVSTFVQGAIAAQAHNVNRQVIADIVSDSTAVALTCAPWATDLSVVSQVMSAVEVASVDIQYRLRLQRNQTIEFVFPYWLKAQMRADWIRRNGPMDPDMTDQMIEGLLRTRNARAQWVYDWQDSFTSTGVSGGPFPGSDTPICALPTSVQFLAYPAGTWVLARQDVIRLDTIYDSTNLATNKVTQLFLEDGFRAMRFCPISRVYTIAICSSGSTGVQRIVTC
jgi:hypothetical protein